jgi:hypothetical protein
VVLVDVERQHAEIGQLPARLRGSSLRANRGWRGVFEAVVLADEAPHGVGQRALLLVEVEVHFRAPLGGSLTGP